MTMQADKDGFLTGTPIGGGDSDRLLGAIKSDTGKILAAMRLSARSGATARPAATPTPRGSNAGRVAMAAAAGAARAAAQALPAAGNRAATPAGRSGAVRARDAGGRYVAGANDSATPTAAVTAQSLTQVAEALTAMARTAEAERRQNKADQVARKRGADGRFGAGDGRGGIGDRLSSLGIGAGAAIDGTERIDPLLGAIGEVSALASTVKNVATPVGRALGGLFGRGGDKAAPEVGWLKRMWRELRGMRKENAAGDRATVRALKDAGGGREEGGGILGLVMALLRGPLMAIAGVAFTAIAGWFTGGALYKWFETLNLGEKFSQAWTTASTYITGKWDTAVKFVSDTFEPARKLFNDLGAWVSNLPGMEKVKEMATKAAEVAGGAVTSAVDAVREALPKAAEAAKRGTEAVMQGATQTKTWIGGKIGDRWNAVKGGVVSAAKSAGVDPGLLAQIAGYESGFNPDARPIKDGKRMSSAHGLGQFLDGTWVDTVRKYGGKYGVSGAEKLTKQQAMALRGDTSLQANMLAEFTAANVAKGRRIGGADDAANSYALHNLGDGDGAKFLRALKANPNTKITEVLSGKVIENNPGLYKGGKVTVGEAYGLMGKEMAGKSNFAADARALARM